MAEFLICRIDRQSIADRESSSHAQKTDPLFRFAVRIDNGFLDERLEPLLAESRTSGHRRIAAVTRPLDGGMTPTSLAA
jgi:hypothetical protein